MSWCSWPHPGQLYHRRVIPVDGGAGLESGAGRCLKLKAGRPRIPPDSEKDPEPGTHSTPRSGLMHQAIATIVRDRSLQFFWIGIPFPL